MRYHLPEGYEGGVAILDPDSAVPELTCVADLWAPPQRSIDLHRHDEWELYLQTAGQSRWSSGDETFSLAPGHLLVAPPGVPHRLELRGASAHGFHVVRFRLDPVLRRLPGLAASWRVRGCRHVRSAEPLELPMRLLKREAATDQPHRSAGLRVMLDEVVITASRLLAQAAAHPLRPLSPKIARVVETIDRAFDRAWTLAELATSVGVTVNHLVRRFTAEVGISPHRYLMQRRLERARQALASSDQPVTEMALQLGFATSQHFAHVFRRHLHCAPRDYRARFRAEAPTGG